MAEKNRERMGNCSERGKRSEAGVGHLVAVLRRGAGYSGCVGGLSSWHAGGLRTRAAATTWKKNRPETHWVQNKTRQWLAMNEQDKTGFVMWVWMWAGLNRELPGVTGSEQPRQSIPASPTT